MKKIFVPVLVALAMYSCKKDNDTVEPAMFVHMQVNEAFKYNEPLSLDVDDDGTDDLAFSNVLVSDSHGAHNLFYMRSLGSNQVLINVQEELPMGNWIAELQENEAVQNNPAKEFEWHRETGYMLDLRQPTQDQTIAEGPLSERSNMYVGFRLAEGSKYKTGWVKLSYTSGADEVVVNEVAFHPLVSQGIKAGQQ